MERVRDSEREERRENDQCVGVVGQHERGGWNWMKNGESERRDGNE